jgi:hypothetical protein
MMPTNSTFFQQIATTEHSSMALHGSLHLIANLGSWNRASGVLAVAKALQTLERLVAGMLGQVLVWLVLLQQRSDSVGGSTAKHNEVQQRVGSQSVSTVD